MKHKNEMEVRRKKISWMEGFKKSKFIFLNALILITLSIAVLSGDTKNIFLNFYEKTTGQQYESFSRLKDLSSETYIILKDKVSRDHHVQLKAENVKIYKKSDTSHKYKITVNDKTFFYKVEKNSNNIWIITKE